MRLYKTPWILKTLFTQLEWKVKTNNKTLYLTFDDGPIPALTNYVLEVLDQYNAKATFFCVGDNLRKFPEIGKNILNAGHVVGNHTYHHIDGWKHRTTDYLQDVQQFELIYQEQFGQPAPCIFRPPYGKCNFNQIKTLISKGYRIIMWDLLSYDFDEKAPHDEGVQKLIGNTDNGSIIVFHDNIKAEKGLKQILPAYLKVFKERGFSFQSLI